jgi:hypothetical protein
MEPFLGQIQLLPYNFAPRGWALCDGQTLQISQNTALLRYLAPTLALMVERPSHCQSWLGQPPQSPITSHCKAFSRRVISFASAPSLSSHVPDRALAS